MSIHKSLLRRFLDLIKSLFISGFLTLLPLALTVTLFAFLFRTAKSWFKPVYLILPDFLKAIPESELIVVFLLILAVGAILKFFILRFVVDMVEAGLGKVPLVRQVYFGIKQLISAFGPKDKQHFQQVVLVEFPRRGTYSVGFLTNEFPSELAPKNAHGEPHAIFYNIFVPHTPNPTTGFFILAPSHECITVPLTRQEAMTLIISGGIIQPDRFTKK